MNAALIRADLLRLARDPMLVVLSVIPPFMAVLVHLTHTSVAAILPPALDMRAVTALLLLLTPMMFGFVYGLMLLDERDEGVLQAVAVTPLGRNGFLLRRMIGPVAWTFLVSLAITLLATGWTSGIHQPVSTVSQGTIGPATAATAAAATAATAATATTVAIAALAVHTLAIAALAALQAPLLALFLAATAADKVQGMALGKVGTMLIGVGALAALAPPPWRWLAAPSPHFWFVHLLTTPSSGPRYILHFTAALLTHVACLTILARAFQRRLG